MASRTMSAQSARPTRSRLTTYAAMATTATATSIAGTAEAAIVVDSSKVNTVVGWNVSLGQIRTVYLAGLPGGGSVKLFTNANASGQVPFAGGPVGVAASWVAGTGVFRMGGPGFRPGFLAAYGAAANAGSYSNAFAYVNRGAGNVSGDIVDNGNAAFSGASPLTSKYLLFNFQSGASTLHGWIEILSMTGSSSGSLPSNYSVTLGRWAYEDTGIAITAGQISLNLVPGGAGLAALAFGAAGLRGRRRGRE